MSEEKESKTIREGFDQEFLENHEKDLKNTALLRAIQAGRNEKLDMSFQTDSRVRRGLDSRTEALVRRAQARKFKCKNSECHQHNQEVPVKYKIVWHQKKLPHYVAKTKDPQEKEYAKIRNEIDFNRFGVRSRSCFHVGVYCRKCGRRIQFVKYSYINRLTAGDFLLLDEEQRRTKAVQYIKE